MYDIAVKKPREQVTDAETLLNLTSTLMTTVELHTTGSVTHSEFISGLLRNFSKHQRRGTSDSSENLLFWRDIGLSISPLFQNVRGCSTMLGPMKNHVKEGSLPLSISEVLVNSFERYEDDDVDQADDARFLQNEGDVHHDGEQKSPMTVKGIGFDKITSTMSNNKNLWSI